MSVGSEGVTRLERLRCFQTKGNIWTFIREQYCAGTTEKYDNALKRDVFPNASPQTKDIITAFCGDEAENTSSQKTRSRQRETNIRWSVESPPHHHRTDCLIHIFLHMRGREDKAGTIADPTHHTQSKSTGVTIYYTRQQDFAQMWFLKAHNECIYCIAYCRTIQMHEITPGLKTKIIKIIIDSTSSLASPNLRMLLPPKPAENETLWSCWDALLNSTALRTQTHTLQIIARAKFRSYFSCM